ncbi:MAG: hypothetical protein FD180_2245 [Planctomycetota bacterium]|nr:MAG: hypothetical protein FD180_2245 [Planctomycetota bacterium]
MDAPIAPSALRHADDGPAYDLISLGLVVFTILLITVWTSHFFRQAPAGLKEMRQMEARVASDPAAMELTTSAACLEAAKWADFNLPSPDGNHLSNEFVSHLKRAIKLEKAERAELRLLLGQGDNKDFDRVAARTELKSEGRARQYARDWYKRRAAWLDACDTRKFEVDVHRELGELLEALSMPEEAAIEFGKIERSLPVIREVHDEDKK